MSSGLVRLEDGSYIERDLLNIVQKVQEFDPNLRIQYLDPNRTSEPGDAPYRIVETCRDGVDRLVFSVWELDDRVIERLYAADMLNPDFIKNLDATNLMARLNSQRRFREEMDEAKDIVEHVVSSTKGRYSIPSADGEGVILIDDTAPERRIK